MGTVVDRVTLTGGGKKGPRHGALTLAVDAAKACLSAEGCAPQEIELLVNAGVFRERNLGEPALAALIQEDIGANPESPHPGKHGTFSFDVSNGTCGALNGLQVADGFLRSGAIEKALVVASDSDPGHGLVQNFPYAAAGAAALCSWQVGEAGFGRFHWVNAPDGGDSWRATAVFLDGKNVIRIEEGEQIDVRLLAAAAEVAAGCLAAAGVAAADLHRVAVAPARPGFVEALAPALGVPADRLVAGVGERWHTASPLAALRAALDDAPAASGARILVLVAGAGVTAGAALYTVP